MLRILVAMTMLAQAPAPGPAPPTGQAPGARAPSPSERTIHADIRFAGAAQRRPLPYETVQGLVIFRAIVAGREAWILLDTGAGRTIVDAALARTAGLRIEGDPITIATPSGTLAGNRVADLGIGMADQMEVRLSGALSADLRPVSALLGRPVGAVLGWDILGRVAFLVDPRGPTLSFSGPGLLPPPAGAAWVSLSGSGRIPVGIAGKQMSLFVDLGSNHVVGLGADVWERLAAKAAETRPWTVTHAQGQGQRTHLGMLPEITLGTARLPDIPTVIESGRPNQGDGHVGMGLLGRFAFMLDAGRGRLWFRTAAPPAPRSAAGR